jgi:hypothetical protein
MYIPKDFRNFENEGQVCKIQKALYVLCQAPRVWYTRIDSYLKIDLILTYNYANSNMCFLSGMTSLSYCYSM